MAFGEHGLHRGQVRAGLERGLQRQAEPVEVACVDLAEADAEVPAVGLQGAAGCQCFGAAAGLAHEGAADDADGPRIEGAFDLDERTCGVDVNGRRAG